MNPKCTMASLGISRLRVLHRFFFEANRHQQGINAEPRFPRTQPPSPEPRFKTWEHLRNGDLETPRKATREASKRLTQDTDSEVELSTGLMERSISFPPTAGLEWRFGGFEDPKPPMRGNLKQPGSRGF